MPRSPTTLLAFLALIAWSGAAPQEVERLSLVWEQAIDTAPLDRKQLEALHHAISQKEDGIVEAVLTGRFDSASGNLLVRGPEGRLTYWCGFGHLSACRSRIVLQAVEVLAQGHGVEAMARPAG